MRPRFLWVELTGRCNSRCGFCSLWKREPVDEVLDCQRLERVLGDELFRGLRIVVLSGGEPTLRDDLEDILATIHQTLPETSVVLSSNASLPDRLLAAVKVALALEMRIEVGVSLDGLGAHHDRVRGMPGLFERADYALWELVKLKREHPGLLRVVAGFLLSDLTISQADAVREYVEGLGIVFNAQWYNQAAYYGNLGRDLLSGRADIEKTAMKLAPSVLHSMGLRALRGQSTKLRCSSMRNFCLLKSNGDLVPCFQMWDLPVGNIGTAAPSAIWASPQAAHARQQAKGCEGCLNTCGVLWSHDADYAAKLHFYWKHPRMLLARLAKARE